MSMDPEELAEEGLAAPKVTLEMLRPYAVRAVWRVLVDDEANDRTRLEAAKLVLERTTPEESGGERAGEGSAAVVDLEARRLLNAWEKFE